jgi:proline iminopeptidase
MALRATVKSSAMEWRLIYDPCITSLYWHDMSTYSVFLKKHLDEPSPGFSYPVYYSIIGDDPDVDVNGTMKGLDLRLRLKSLDKPFLVITGRADKVATVQQAFEIQRLIPNSQIHIFNKSGHLPFAEENTLFSEILTDFLIR